jgi:hypothetical protein
MTKSIDNQNQSVKVLGTLVAPGDFRWEIPIESASQETLEIVECLRNSYMSQEMGESHIGQLPTCLTKVV